MTGFRQQHAHTFVWICEMICVCRSYPILPTSSAHSAPPAHWYLPASILNLLLTIHHGLNRDRSGDQDRSKHFRRIESNACNFLIVLYDLYELRIHISISQHWCHSARIPGAMCSPCLPILSKNALDWTIMNMRLHLISHEVS